MHPGVFYKAVKRCSVTGRLYPWADPGLTYEPGASYELPDPAQLRMAAVGFHACANAQAMVAGQMGYAAEDPVLAVQLGRDAYPDTYCTKWVASAMHVLREVPAAELAELRQVPYQHLSAAGFEWYVNLQLHREDDLPAMGHANGTLVWCRHGVRDRDHGRPAVVYGNGAEEYWVQGVRRRGPKEPRPSRLARLLAWVRFGGEPLA